MLVIVETLGITIAHNTRFCIDTMMKYKGCHFEQIAATRVQPRTESNQIRYAPLAHKLSTVDTVKAVTTGRKILLLLPRVSSMHSKRYTLFKKQRKKQEQLVIAATPNFAQC